MLLDCAKHRALICDSLVTIVMVMMTRLLGIIIGIICSVTIIILVRSIVVIVINSGCNFVRV